MEWSIESRGSHAGRLLFAGMRWAVRKERPVSNFARTLGSLRRQRDLTLDGLALSSGVHKSQLSRYERGLRPSLDAIHHIACALGVAPDSLVDAAFADLPEPNGDAR